MGSRGAELLKRCFRIDVHFVNVRGLRPESWTQSTPVLECPTCKGRMKLLAMVTEPKSIRRLLRHLGEPTEPPAREPARGPPFWRSRVLRRAAHRDDLFA